MKNNNSHFTIIIWTLWARLVEKRKRISEWWEIAFWWALLIAIYAILA